MPLWLKALVGWEEIMTRFRAAEVYRKGKRAVRGIDMSLWIREGKRT